MKKLSAVIYTPPGISVLIVAACLFANASIADPVYKSTNAQGEVSFSDKPLPNATNVEQVKVPPAPTEAEQQESAERVRRMESQADEIGSARRERSQQPDPEAPQGTEEPVTGTHTYSGYDDDKERRRRAIINKRLQGGAEGGAAARRAPHAGGGGRGR